MFYLKNCVLSTVNSVCLVILDHLFFCPNLNQYLYYFTRAAPKVMPPIYFHGNYNRYKEYNNTI